MKLNLLVLRVADFARSRAFYEAMGLLLVEERHGNGPVHLSATLDGCVLELYPASSIAPTTASTRFGPATTDFDRTVDQAVTAGGSLIIPPGDSPWGGRAIIADPDGNKIELPKKP